VPTKNYGEVDLIADVLSQDSVVSFSG